MKGTVRYHSDALPYDVSVVAVPRCVCLFNAHVHNKKRRRWINSRNYISATLYEKCVCQGCQNYFCCGTLYVCGVGVGVGMGVGVENRQTCDTYALKLVCFKRLC